MAFVISSRNVAVVLRTLVLTALVCITLVRPDLQVRRVMAQEETPDSTEVASDKTSESFKTIATSTYTVGTTGTTRVEHRFTITNLKPTTYLKQYLIKLQFPSVSEITATNQGQDLKPYVVKDGSTTTITLNFDDDVVGEGKTRVFTIAYATKDVAMTSGNVLEVRIPSLAGAQESQHQVYVNTPLRFGKPVRTSPQPDKQVVAGDQLQLQFNTFPTGGVSALFGNEQTYALKTRYLLKNPSSSLGYTQIALPPDTSYQRMEYQTLEPRPESMKIDEDGNWIATYLVPAKTQLDVLLDAQVKVTLEPDPLIPVIQPTAEHLAPKPFWQSNTEAIKSFAQPAQLRPIYDGVIKALTYDTKRVEQGDITTRLGAEEVLATPEAAVCQEYADLLIAGWRSAGIPARRLNGYAFSQNTDIRPLSFRGTVLHAWVDYFDQANGVWRMVDPTWEDTTGGVDYFTEFDLNHIVLSINGFSSSDPAPAGSYVESPEEAMLDVRVISASESARPDFTATLTPTTAVGVTIPGSYQLTIANQTGRAWYDTHVILAAESDIQLTTDQKTVTFLPFEEKTFSLTLTTPLQIGWKTTSLTLTLVPAGEKEPYVIKKDSITAAPAIVSSLASIDPTTPLGVLAILSFLAAGSLLVFRRKRKAPVRRQSQKSQKTTEQLPPSETTIGPNPTDGPGGGDSPLA